MTIIKILLYIIIRCDIELYGERLETLFFHAAYCKLGNI
jgi:nicotinamide riboside transporter PnuC